MGWKQGIGAGAVLAALLSLAACGSTKGTGATSTPAPAPSAPSPPLSPTPTASPAASPAPPASPTPVPSLSPTPRATPAASPNAAPPVTITESDGGHTLTMPLGATAKLELPTTMAWSEPAVGGSAVTVTPVNVPTQTGFDIWNVTAVAAGQATIRSGGSPICSPGQACPQLIVAFTVTISVP